MAQLVGIEPAGQHLHQPCAHGCRQMVDSFAKWRHHWISSFLLFDLLDLFDLLNFRWFVLPESLSE
jgi:hypothetical protein